MNNTRKMKVQATTQIHLKYIMSSEKSQTQRLHDSIMCYSEKGKSITMEWMPAFTDQESKLWKWL